MSRSLLVLIAFVVGIAVGALGLQLVADDAHPARIAALESDLADARRDAHDYERVARAERTRRTEVSDELERVRAVLESAEAQLGAGAHSGDADGAGAHGMPATQPGLPPSEWDERRLRDEVTRLSLSGPQMSRSPLIDRCAAAAKAQGETALGMLLSVLRVDDLDDRLVRAAAMVLEKLNDPRAVNMLTQRWAAATELDDQRTFLRALANIDGDAQIDTLLAAWRDASLDPRLRLVAIHGLAVRAHPVAIGLVTSPASPGEEGLRARAIESVHFAARRSDYENRQLIPALSTALLTADGEAQMRIALLGLEGFWDSGCVPALRAYAAGSRGPDEVRARAASIADAIEAGAPRPAKAGQAREPQRRMEDE